MKIRLIRTQKDFQFPFPGGVEKCANALFFRVGLGSADKFEMVVAYTMRPAHEKNRRRIHVGLRRGNTYRPLVQFEGTDDYSETGDCICFVKQADSNEQVPIDDPIPLEYTGHRIAIFERHIQKGGKDHWGIIVNEGEIDDMLRVGLIRAGHKGYKETP